MVQALRIELFLPEIQSLKDKRQVRQSLTQRLKAMNISVIEYDRADDHKHLILLLAYVSLGENEARDKRDKVLELISQESEHVTVEQEALYLD